MRDEIYKKLNGIQDLNERMLLKKILGSVFTSLQDYSKERYDLLEERVFNELEYCEANYNLFCTIVNKEDIDPTNEFLYPMLQQDLEEKLYDANDMVTRINNKEEVKIFKVFLKCNYPTYKNIISQGMVFKGVIETDKRSYEGQFTLSQNKEYWDEVVNLYRGFIDNNIPWTTLNNPYISKIADVVLVGAEEGLTKEDTITKISVDFGEYSKYVNYNMIPLWNVRKLSFKTSGFPMPCEDSINYEHIIPLKKEEADHGYIVEYKNCKIHHVVRKKDSLIIASPTEEAQLWEMWKVIANPKSTIESYSNEITSNGRNSNFTDRFIIKKGMAIKTKGELIRIINSFQFSHLLEFQYVTLEDKWTRGNDESYDMNYFIIDEIREEDIKKALLLCFKPRDINSYLIYDILSFLVSEIQLHYPEYKCEGRLL